MNLFQHSSPSFFPQWPSVKTEQLYHLYRGVRFGKLVKCERNLMWHKCLYIPVWPPRTWIIITLAKGPSDPVLMKAVAFRTPSFPDKGWLVGEQPNHTPGGCLILTFQFGFNKKENRQGEKSEAGVHTSSVKWCTTMFKELPWNEGRTLNNVWLKYSLFVAMYPFMLKKGVIYIFLSHISIIVFESQ